jgi:hypothetical protein
METIQLFTPKYSELDLHNIFINTHLRSISNNISHDSNIISSEYNQCKLILNSIINSKILPFKTDNETYDNKNILKYIDYIKNIILKRLESIVDTNTIIKNIDFDRLITVSTGDNVDPQKIYKMENGYVYIIPVMLDNRINYITLSKYRSINMLCRSREDDTTLYITDSFEYIPTQVFIELLSKIFGNFEEHLDATIKSNSAIFDYIINNMNYDFYKSLKISESTSTTVDDMLALYTSNNLGNLDIYDKIALANMLLLSRQDNKINYGILYVYNNVYKIDIFKVANVLFELNNSIKLLNKDDGSFILERIDPYTVVSSLILIKINKDSIYDSVVYTLESSTYQIIQNVLQNKNYEVIDTILNNSKTLRQLTRYDGMNAIELNDLSLIVDKINNVISKRKYTTYP